MFVNQAAAVLSKKVREIILQGGGKVLDLSNGTFSDLAGNPGKKTISIF